jgi:hypothetical protein
VTNFSLTFVLLDLFLIDLSPSVTINEPVIQLDESSDCQFIEFTLDLQITNISSLTSSDRSFSLDVQQTVIESLLDISHISSSSSSSVSCQGILEDPAVAISASLRQLTLEIQFFLDIREFPQFINDKERHVYNYMRELFNDIRLLSEKIQQNALVWGKELYFSRVLSTQWSDFRPACPEGKTEEGESSPSSQPTTQPTTQPSLQPTGEPSSSYTAPSSSLIIPVFLGLSNVSLSLTSLSIEDQNALLSTIADILDISQSTVQFNEVVDRGNHLIEVSLSITILNLQDDYQEFNGNSTKVYSYLTQLLKESIHDNELRDRNIFTKLLQKQANHCNAMDLASSIVFRVEYQQFGLFSSSSPTSFPVISASSISPTILPASVSSSPSSSPVVTSPPSAYSFSISPSASSFASFVPTTSPSLSNSVHYLVIFHITNLGELTFSLNSQQAITSTIQDVEAIFPLELITFINTIIETTPSPEAPKRRKERRNRRNLESSDNATSSSSSPSSSSSLLIEATIIIDLSFAIPEGKTESQVYHETSLLLTNAISGSRFNDNSTSSSFNSLFHSYCRQHNAIESFNATFTDISFQGIPSSVFSSSSDDNNKENKLSVIFQVVIVISGILFLGFVGYLLFSRGFAKSKNSLEGFTSLKSNSSFYDSRYQKGEELFILEITDGYELATTKEEEIPSFSYFGNERDSSNLLLSRLGHRLITADQLDNRQFVNRINSESHLLGDSPPDSPCSTRATSVPSSRPSSRPPSPPPSCPYQTNGNQLLAEITTSFVM